MTTLASFGSRLRVAMDTRGPLCIGVDPHPSLIAAWGLPDDPTGLERFSLTVVEALADRVAVLKPQSAFFERHGSRGIAVLERTIGAAHAAGALVLLDAKRGDIGSTVEAYAQAYLDQAGSFGADAITASPYLGFESLRPLYDAAVQHAGGVFVLAYTSNPEGTTVQRATGTDGRPVGTAILDAVAAENEGASPLGSVGAVVGATVASVDYDFAKLNGPILAPGLGVQGGTGESIGRLFGAARSNVLPSTSRGILRHGPAGTSLRDAAARALDAPRERLPRP
jgi:orotidine 5'-phosphate decarboxylase subfamily 2